MPNNPLGWAALEPSQNVNADQFGELMRQQFDLNAKIHAAFKSKGGKEVIKWLREATIESAAWMPSVALQHGIEAANAHAYAREGQNALVRDIERRIELADKCKTPDDLARFVKPATE